jgi:N-acetylglucosamine PTS system EIICBA or EIICB component
VLHALATGLAMVVMNFFGVRLGFSFSAGLFDYVLNFSHAQRPLLLLPIGAAYFGLYYGVFRWLIVRLNLATPGREIEDATSQSPAPTNADERARAFVAALGGAGNLTEVAACTTRLRLRMVDNQAVDEATLKRLGARGILRASAQGLQVVLGPIADQVAGEIRAALRSAPPALTPARAEHDATALLAALGGRTNVMDLETAAGRLLIRTARPESIDEPALAKLGIRGIARSSADRVQVLVTGVVEEWAEPLRRLL